MVLTSRTGPFGEQPELRVLDVEELREATVPRLRKAKRPASLPNAYGVMDDEAGAVPDATSSIND